MGQNGPTGPKGPVFQVLRPLPLELYSLKFRDISSGSVLPL